MQKKFPQNPNKKPFGYPYTLIAQQKEWEEGLGSICVGGQIYRGGASIEAVSRQGMVTLMLDTKKKGVPA